MAIGNPLYMCISMGTSPQKWKFSRYPRQSTLTKPTFPPVFAARQAKYDLKRSTDGLEGLADIAYNVEDAREDAAQKARAVWGLSCVVDACEMWGLA